MLSLLDLCHLLRVRGQEFLHLCFERLEPRLQSLVPGSHSLAVFDSCIALDVGGVTVVHGLVAVVKEELDFVLEDLVVLGGGLQLSCGVVTAGMGVAEQE